MYEEVMLQQGLAPIQAFLIVAMVGVIGFLLQAMYSPKNSEWDTPVDG